MRCINEAINCFEYSKMIVYKYLIVIYSKKPIIISSNDDDIAKNFLNLSLLLSL
ncbi:MULTISPECIES: hypothetical protein [Saccharolobus]|uniref:hypothetical protein n=1 Tax=Saccharolobus TaxID=2100760 RepID=UPI001F0E63AF|nr:hypothetical protein [Saccharolobus shibatae]MCH4816834.1 hypothetical protein [Saccharolobus shibatae]